MSAERAVEWRTRVWGSVAHLQRRYELRLVAGGATHRTPRSGDLHLVPDPLTSPGHPGLAHRAAVERPVPPNRRV
jgi:hypothetical protein